MVDPETVAERLARLGALIAQVFQSLGHLDDLRAFAAAIQRIVDADG